MLTEKDCEGLYSGNLFSFLPIFFPFSLSPPFVSFTFSNLRRRAACCPGPSITDVYISFRDFIPSLANCCTRRRAG